MCISSSFFRFLPVFSIFSWKKLEKIPFLPVSFYSSPKKPIFFWKFLNPVKLGSFFFRLNIILHYHLVYTAHAAWIYLGPYFVDVDTTWNKTQGSCLRIDMISMIISMMGNVNVLHVGHRNTLIKFQKKLCKIEIVAQCLIYTPLPTHKPTCIQAATISFFPGWNARSGKLGQKTGCPNLPK